MHDAGELDLDLSPLDRIHDIATAETIVKYEGYLKRQEAEVERSRREEYRLIGEAFPYEAVPGLSKEVVQRLTEVKPRTLGQAARIPGITPAAVALVGVFLERFSHDDKGIQRSPRKETPPGRPVS
jgi:tRNA U34 5-carboxymethylaminomethyl modifying enzyme MnmG/GidA